MLVPTTIPPTGVTLGSIFVFVATIQSVCTGKAERVSIQVAAYDFEQALSNLERAYPELSPIADEIRLRKAVGEFKVPNVT